MSKRRSHHLWFLLAVLAGVGLLAWLWPREGDTPANFSAQSPTTSPDVAAATSLPATRLAQQPPDASAEVIRADGKRELQAYRIAVRGGLLSLDGTERIAGDFHRRRGPQAWMPGMWCVRLLDAEGRVLAEETAQAPNEVCLVGDPRNLGANGLPQATQYAGAGEEAMLQVRLPPHPEAKLLKVYRISSLERAGWDTEPMGSLLATLPLP